MSKLSKLGDKDLRGALCALARQDRDVLVETLWHLAELERRRSYLEWGFHSLWDFCRRELAWSEGSSRRRIEGAKLLSRVPEAAGFIQDGRISLCAIAVIAKHLNAGNAAELLKKACGLTKRAAEELIATTNGNGVVRRSDVIRLVGAHVSKKLEGDSLPLALDQDVSEAHQVPTATVDAAGQPGAQTAPAERIDHSSDGVGQATALPTPVSKPERVHRIAFDADEALVANIKRLQDVLGKRDLGEVMRRATEALLDKVDPLRRHARREAAAGSKAAEAAKPRLMRATKAASTIKQTITKSREFVNILRHRQPLAVRDAISARDGAQCTFVSKDGVRCTAKSYLQVDHIRPFSLGGSSTDPDNNRILCAAHNLARNNVKIKAKPPKGGGPEMSLQ
jgi:hypothetical protein